MNESLHDVTWMPGIDLALESDFDLGSLRVRPAVCKVELNGVSQVLQRRVMQVLVTLAQARGSVVSQKDLVARCWRGLSVSEDAIYRCISKLRKLASDYPDAPYAIDAIPGVGYRLTSSSPIEDRAPVDSAATRANRFRVGAFAGAAALLVLLLAASAFWMLRDRGAAPQPSRVAVRPFESLTDSADARSLARRIPNEIVDALGDSQIEAVLEGEQARKDTMSSGGPPPGLIVTGILRDDGHNSVVDVRLEDGASHAALWSREFKRDSHEVVDLPEEVAARVADVVDMVGFARSVDPPLRDNSALSALLQTSDMIRDSRGGDWAQLIEHAQAVVTRHPEFTFGHSLLALAYAEAAENIDVADRAKSMREAAWKEANLTLELDPKDAGAYGVLADLELEQQPYDQRASEAILLRGIKLATHPKEPLGALYQYEGATLANVGRLREALSFQLIAQATDRWSPSKWTKLALIYANMGNLAEARSALQKGAQRWPTHRGLRSGRLYVAAFYEQPSDALAVLDHLDAQTLSDEDDRAVWRTFIKAKAAHSARLTGLAISQIGEAADQARISRETEIMMFTQLGETKQAIEAAMSALDRNQILQPGFLFTPVTRDLRRDPAFVDLAFRTGLIKYWRETRKLPDFCTDQRARSECSRQLLAAVKW